jgi:hypothetical protein
MLRRVESVTGITAAVVGLIGLVMFAFATGYEESEEETTGVGTATVVTHESPPLIDDQTGPTLRIILVAVPILGAVAFGAWKHARGGSTGSGVLLIVATILLWMGAMVGAFSVGLFVIPAALLALVSLIACGLGRDPVAEAPG